MQAVRYRLRWLAGVTQESVTYGSGLYGSDEYGQLLTPNAYYGSGMYGTFTYGQTAVDPLTALTYEAIPWTGGQPTTPSWLYRSGDTRPIFRARILADGEPADIGLVDKVYVVLHPVDARNDDHTLVFDGAVDSTVKGMVTRAWQPGDLEEHGVYRCLINLGFQSGRRITIPCDDRHTFHILDESRSVIEFGRYGSGDYGDSSYGPSRIVP